jgi:hypothetical protein
MSSGTAVRRLLDKRLRVCYLIPITPVKIRESWSPLENIINTLRLLTPTPAGNFHDIL